MNPIKITIVCTKGTDTVMVEMDAPSPVWPFDEQNLTLKFEAAKGTGVEYCAKHFPSVPVTVIEVQ